MKQEAEVNPSTLTDAELLNNFDGMYNDGDADIRLYAANVVRIRKAQKCPGNFAGALHSVVKGSRMIRERALVDGEWRTCYTCESCVIGWAKERGIL